MENTRKQIIINPAIMRAAKALYKGGAYAYASDSAFIRAVFEDISNTVMKKVKKGVTK